MRVRTMFAVLKTGGKQYKVAKNDIIEIERLPTGQPSVRLHGRAAARATQLGMGRVAVSISHETDYAVAIAFGVRSTGGAYVFPPDIEARLDDRERRILERIQQLRELTEAGPGA